jgi:epoxide hydrolase-like predicted phosphatase
MEIRRYIQPIILAIAFCNPFWTAAKDIIFDFGGVLFFTNKMASFRQIGITNVATCSFQLGINPLHLDNYIKPRLFAFLDEVASQSHLDIPACEAAFDEKGNQLPLLMNAWLQGHITPEEILIGVEKALKTHPEWFKCSAEKRIIQNTARLIFTPELFIGSRKISPDGIAFIKKCKKQGHRVYGLSNWDAQSYVLLKKQYPELFDLFDGVVISAQEKANKPHPTIYQILLNRYDLKPQDCWFIDDQQENIDAAKKLGINAVRYTSTFAKVKQDIKLAHSKSLSLKKDLSTNGNSDNNTKNANSAIIDGEKISLTDSTKYNCLPAKA